MKKSSFLKIFSFSSLLTIASVFLVSCGENKNPYENTSTFDSFKISSIENANLLQKIAQKKIPVRGSKEVTANELKTLTFTSSEQYWEIVLFCQNKFLGENPVQSYEIIADKSTESKTKIIFNDTENFIINSLETMNEQTVDKRVHWNQEILGEKPISWIFVNYKVTN